MSCHLVDAVVRLRVSASTAARRPATHVAQVYLNLEGEEAWGLAGVVRTAVPAGGEATGTLDVPARAFARGSRATGRSEPVPGRHRLRVGAHSADDSGPHVTVRIRDGAIVAVQSSAPGPRSR